MMGSLMAMDTAEIIRVHQLSVWRYLRFLGAGEALADDLTQEVFVAVLSQPFEYENPARTSAFLRTVARNQFVSALRKLKREISLDDINARESTWVEISGDDEGAAHREALDGCLEKLPERPRHVLRSYYGGDQSRGESAAALGMTDEALKKFLWRVRETLRECIERSLARG
ncbi:MAG: sigma-70 family RNA polymerase sigma factor [Planctomycetes bacterium]|nr:sigma-70 family RNA polymerase sigma factor [Planctomycetota bacterium]